MLLSANDIRAGLLRLGQLAADHGEHIQLVIVGGAVMALAYDARQSTRDVDALFMTPPEAATIRDWVRVVAEEFGWPGDWLNDGAKGFLHGLRVGPLLLESNGIEVRQVAPEQLLAMKLSAWRDDTDIADARRILEELIGLGDREAVWRAVEPFVVPGQELKARYALEDLWNA